MKTNDWKDEEIAIPDGLEARLEQLIDDLAEQEMQTKRRRLWGTFSAAASIALLLSIGAFFYPKQRDNSQLIAQHIENQELAYSETLKALEKVSVNFNKGMNQLEFMSEKMEKTNQILDKTFNTEIK